MTLGKMWQYWLHNQTIQTFDSNSISCCRLLWKLVIYESAYLCNMYMRFLLLENNSLPFRHCLELSSSYFTMLIIYKKKKLTRYSQGIGMKWFSPILTGGILNCSRELSFIGLQEKCDRYIGCAKQYLCMYIIPS